MIRAGELFVLKSRTLGTKTLIALVDMESPIDIVIDTLNLSSEDIAKLTLTGVVRFLVTYQYAQVTEPPQTIVLEDEIYDSLEA